MDVSVLLISTSVRPSAVSSIVAIRATMRAVPSSPSIRRSAVGVMSLSSEVHVPRRHFERGDEIGDVLLSALCRAGILEERGVEAAERRHGCLDAERDLHLADAIQVGVE